MKLGQRVAELEQQLREATQSADRLRERADRVEIMNTKLREELEAARSRQPRVVMNVSIHGGAVDFNGTAHSGR